MTTHFSRLTSWQFTAFTALTALSLTATLAQAQVVVPPSAQPGLVEQHYRLEEQRPDVGGPTIITLPDEGGKQKALKPGVEFTLKAVHFQGNTVYSEADLEAATQPYIGQKVSLITLNKIASEITAKYRNDGYILSRAVIAPQHIDGGVVTFRVIEGYVNDVRFEGLNYKSWLLTRYGDHIKEARPLDAKTLERYLLLMEDLPGVSARAVIQPAPGITGASDVIVTIEQKHLDGTVSTDNRGSKYLGPVEGGLVTGFNNLTGLFDRTQLHGVMTSDPHEMRYGELDHEEQVDSEGTKLDLQASYTHTDPGGLIKYDDITGVNRFYSISLTHPFIRSRQENWFGTITYDDRDTDSDSFNDRLYVDKLHVLRLGNEYDFVDGLEGVDKIEGALAKGFNFDTSGDGVQHSRIDGKPDFEKLTAHVTRLQPLSTHFNLFVSAIGQYADEPLLTAEQLALGGPAFGSAYDPAEIAGDNGISGRAELQYNRTGDFKYLPTYQLYGFYDAGKVWDRGIPQVGEPGDQSLASAGVGTRFNIMDPLSGSLELAFPLTKKVAALGSDGNDPRLFFALSYHFDQ